MASDSILCGLPVCLDECMCVCVFVRWMSISPRGIRQHYTWATCMYVCMHACVFVCMYVDAAWCSCVWMMAGHLVLVYILHTYTHSRIDTQTHLVISVVVWARAYHCVRAVEFFHGCASCCLRDRRPARCAIFWRQTRGETARPHCRSLG